MDTYDVTLTLTEPLLGTVPLDPEIYRRWIIEHKGMDPEALADELESVALASEGVDEETEKGTTGFHRLEDGTPFLYDYVIKGFFKDACGMLRRDKESGSAKVNAYKRVIDGLVFAKPRQIPLNVAGDEEILTRPLRADTAQGPRVALARSIMVPPGSSLSFRVLILSQVPQKLLEEWLVYGALRGLGQWRNGGYGSFDYELAKR